MTNEQFFILTYKNLILESEIEMKSFKKDPLYNDFFAINFLHRIDSKVNELKIQDSLERIPND